MVRPLDRHTGEIKPWNVILEVEAAQLKKDPQDASQKIEYKSNKMTLDQEAAEKLRKRVRSVSRGVGA